MENVKKKKPGRKKNWKKENGIEDVCVFFFPTKKKKINK